MNLTEYPDVDMLMLQLARRLSRELREALARRERALFAVPGGATPGPLFDLLAAADLDWDRVDVIPSDERWVPPDHPRSNAALVRARLLRGKAAPARLIALWRPCPTPDTAMDDILAAVDPLLPVDVALVGMGVDMHTASLFAGADGLALALAHDAPAVVAITDPGTGESRVTLSARVFTGAYALHVLIIGDDKRTAIDRAAGLAPSQAPVKALLGQASVHWSP